jgi:hypothetical protein
VRELEEAEDVREPQARRDDDRQDQRRSRRLTRARSMPVDDRPRARVGAGFGYGRLHINASELGRRDEEDASVLRLDGEFWLDPHLGFGFTAELVATDDDLFQGQQVESGVGLRPADAELHGHDISAYFAWDPLGGERFRLPLEIGPWISSTFLDYDRANIDYTFTNVGLRVGATPELKIVDTRSADVSLFAGASYSIGFTDVYEDLIGNNEDYDSEAQQFRAEAGLRVDLRAVTLGLHYVYSDTGINLSDPEFGRRIPEIDFYTNMFFFTVGARF